ncbi:MAG: ATP-binding protein [Nostocaceae cyanobacterium]|nr:ATP-binding protein [Nostocaceae cyanobacterium]
MSAELLESFKKAYSNLDLFPLMTKKEIKEFRVDYGDDIIADLEQLVEDSPNGDGKIIFTGHRGCGKSTLLAEFKNQIQENNYFVVLFSIANTIEMSAVNHINILFAIALQLMSEAEAKQVEIPSNTKKAIEDWFAKRTRVLEKEGKVENKLGFNIFNLISTELKADATVREEITKEFERKISDLVAQINLIASLIQTVTKKKILVIIDDLDKLDLAKVREIFQDNIKALCQPGFQIIYTIPIAVIRETVLSSIINSEIDDQLVPMPVLKLFEKGKSRQPEQQTRTEATDILCSILQKRISRELLESQTAIKIVIQSGGVLREMIRIAQECCRICLRNIRRKPGETVIINDEILEQAIKKLRNDFTIRLGKVDFEILATTYQEFMPDDPKQQEFLDLLHGLYVLEYRNDETWYDVHPILVETLSRRGLINGE